MRVSVYLGRAGASFGAGVRAGFLKSWLWVALDGPTDLPDVRERSGACSQMYVRDVLDGAVRALAVGTGPFGERLLAAGAVLSSSLSRADFDEEEDRALYDQILLGFLELDLAGEETQDQASAEVSDTLAANIVDLRDGLAGRAVREARIDAERKVPGESEEPHL